MNSKLKFLTTFPFTFAVSLLFGIIFSSFNATDAFASVNQWSATGNLNYTRQGAAAVLLSSGKALVTGGNVNGATILPNSASTELYDPSAGTWTTSGSMNTARTAHTATVLQNGKVLVAGGSNTNSAELYDPSTGVWTVTGSMNDRRFFHTATLLNNGKVLVAGGNTSTGGNNTSELYDPSTGVWTYTGTMTSGHTSDIAVLLQNGKVLVAGGTNTTGSLTNVAEIYDPSTGTWTATGSMTTPRWSAAASILPNGKVLVVGGESSTDILSSAEVYDPSTGTWTTTGSLNQPSVYHTLTLLSNGKVLRAGGRNNSQYIPNGELYDSSSGTWSATGNMVTPRNYHTATLLTNGTVLVTGGSNSSGMLTSSELYTPTTLQNQITYYTANNGTTFSRSTSPFTLGVATQTANSDGSVTVSVNNTTGYADSGFVLYEGTLGNLPNFTVNGTGNQYGLNLWFDVNNDNEYFTWLANVLTGLGGDTYGLGPTSSSGTDAVTGSSLFYLISDGHNHSLSDLKNGLVSGITSNTKVAVWVGVNTNTGSTSSTIQSISGLY